jgi:hypothetical protein
LLRQLAEVTELEDMPHALLGELTFGLDVENTEAEGQFGL